MNTTKKSYNTPSLEVFGTVSDLTQAFGSSSASDLVFAGTSNFGDGDPTTNDLLGQSTGSHDAILVPYN